MRYGSTMCHDTALGAATCAIERATRLAAKARVAIKILYCDRKRPATWPCVTTQCCDTVRQRARAHSDTPATRPRHDRAQAAKRPGEGHETAPGAPRHDRPSEQRARSLGHGCVHSVHLTHF